MKSLYKRFLSIICTLVMVINILPVQVFAVGDDGVKEENAVLPEMTDDEPKSTFDGDTVFSAPKLLTTNAQIIIGGKITDYNGAGLERAAVYVTDATDEIICGKMLHLYIGYMEHERCQRAQICDTLSQQPIQLLTRYVRV